MEPSAVQPETRYTYTALYAYYKDSGETIVQASTPVYRLTEVSTCATTASCDGGADEVLTEIEHGSTGVANNLLPTSVSSGSGNGSLTATIDITYSPVGDRLTVDGPLSGSDDTTRYRYDDARQPIGIVGPDPDGGGSLKHRALRYTYNDDGQVTLIEQGNVTSQSDAAWASFSALQSQGVDYDTLGRRVQDSLVVSSTTYAVQQYSYDDENRPECAALRMNPDVFGSLPASACTHGTPGVYGPDRIVKTVYNAADQVSVVKSAFGTALQIDAVTRTYTDNGLPETIADGNGNLTTYEYDGFDRLKKRRYPDASDGSSSSTTDYDEYTYDANSQVATARRRDGQTFAFDYDDLGRLIDRDAPGSDPDVTYEYDNLGRMTDAAQSGNALEFEYDVLGRTISTTGPLGEIEYEYDLSGRRTKVTWPDSFYVDYDYDAVGAMTKVRENGATSGVGVLAAYGYDDYGRRASLSRGNGVTTSYGYDAISRLETLTHDLDGSSDDLTLDFERNPAGQITLRDSSNAAYDWDEQSVADEAYTNNDLNQVTDVDSTSLTYDSRGNLTSDGSTTFGYDAGNKLVSASGGVTLSYDPVGRLYEVGGGSTTRFLSDGAETVAEYNSSDEVIRRYVHGASIDEPLVWYEGDDTSDRRWLVADDLGSTVAVTDGDGEATTINIYDAYGLPGTLNAGRFQYTRQMWIAEVSLYHYKSRVYAPGLGQFLQPDPIGYSGGLNLYGYVGNDPVNRLDPFGLFECSGKYECIVTHGSKKENPCPEFATCYSGGSFYLWYDNQAIPDGATRYEPRGRRDHVVEQPDNGKGEDQTISTCGSQNSEADNVVLGLSDDAWAQTQKLGVEVGGLIFSADGGLIAGPTYVGQPGFVELGRYFGQLSTAQQYAVVAAWHTHPNGTITFSVGDVEFQQALSAPLYAISASGVARIPINDAIVHGPPSPGFAPQYGGGAVLGYPGCLVEGDGK